MNIYIEYLENIKLFNLIITLEDENLIDEYCFDKNKLNLSIRKNSSLSEKELKFDGYEIDKESFLNFKKNFKSNDGSLESIFKFRIKNIIEKVATQYKESNTNFKELSCSNCKQNLLKPKDFTVLQLPENEISELADNFFCHLHSHGHEEHSHHSDEKLIDSLNPLIIKKDQVLRKSILQSETLFILNTNHLNPNQINEINSSLSCNNCGYIVGYKIKNNSFDFFLWKSNLVENSQKDARESMLYLLKTLTNGRYLIETKTKPTKYIYIFILNDNFAFKNYLKCKQTSINFKELFDTKSKKLIYKITTINEESIQNDYNITSFIISDQHFDFLSNFLNNSTQTLPPSVKLGPNSFMFALI